MFRKKGSRSALVNLSPMSDSQDHDLRSLKVDDHTIVADAKPIRPKFRLFKRLSVGKRVLLVPLERFADALLYSRLERIEVFDRTVGIDQPVRHRPNTSA